jgi:hypothetical protein
VISAVGLLWRLRKAGPHAAVSEESAAEKRALYVVAITFFLLAIYIAREVVTSLIRREEPLTSPVGIILAVLSLVVMPASRRLIGSFACSASLASSVPTWCKASPRRQPTRRRLRRSRWSRPRRVRPPRCISSPCRGVWWLRH